MFCIAMETSTLYQFGEAFWSPQPTITVGDSTRNLAYLPLLAKVSLFSRLLTIMKCQGWIFPADGANLAASKILSSFSSGTDVGSYVRVECLFWTASKTSI